MEQPKSPIQKLLASKMLHGGLIGMAITLAAGVAILPRLMFSEIQSTQNYEDTIAFIVRNVTQKGWKVSALMRLDKSLAQEGKTVLPAASFKICQADYAERILKDDDARFLTVMMPCSIGVYEKADGKTYVSTMNAGLLGRLFGGTAAKVMAGSVAKETRGFIEPLELK